MTLFLTVACNRFWQRLPGCSSNSRSGLRTSNQNLRVSEAFFTFRPRVSPLVHIRADFAALGNDEHFLSFAATQPAFLSPFFHTQRAAQSKMRKSFQANGIRLYFVKAILNFSGPQLVELVL